MTEIEDMGINGLTALVLAGGQGERLRPYTENRPKPMVPVNGRPVLEYHLTWLRDGGVKKAFLLCGYLHNVIKEHFGEGNSLGMELEYVVEEEPLGTGGAIKQGLARLDSGVELAIATNGDTITEQSVGDLVRVHQQHSGLATVMLVSLISPYGIVDTEDDGRVREFVEKPALPYWLNAGVYVLDPAVQAYLPDRGDYERTAFPALARDGQMYSYKSTALWIGVDTVKDLSDASRILATRTTT